MLLTKLTYLSFVRMVYGGFREGVYNKNKIADISVNGKGLNPPVRKYFFFVLKRKKMNFERISFYFGFFISKSYGLDPSESIEK